ncbi:MAG: nitronate monooxygenase [Phycisphaeraceae bacterium]|nr:nitronate monooxygenase [Phycisphaeraceae bacterium]
MGVGVSSWTLAREVALHGQLGVVSGTALDTILIRRLACGDLGGHMRRAISAFPFRAFSQRFLQRYFRTGLDTYGETATPIGTEHDHRNGVPPPSESLDSARPRHPLLPLPRTKLTRDRALLLMLANFVEVRLAKAGHDGVVGINYLHKIQLPILPSLYGAMLAGVDAVLIGAGIPGDIPETLDRFVEHRPASLTLELLDAGAERRELSFDPGALWSEEASGRRPPPMQRPEFLAIVSSVTLSRALLKKAPGGIDGLVVERSTAGGHNAPPRGPMQLSREGEPIYGPRDEVNPADLTPLGVPFWLAGGYATRKQFHAAVAAGARGVQIGTAFAFCNESGLDPPLRAKCLDAVLRNDAHVFTDPAASPTRFPFKVVELPETLSTEEVYDGRPRVCDLGYLRRAYLKPDGTIGYRCPAEPVDDYVRKDGDAADTVGRKCLCNALLANIGLAQRRADGYEEPPLLTAGDDLDCLRQFISADHPTYSARDVIEAIL